MRRCLMLALAILISVVTAGCVNFTTETGGSGTEKDTIYNSSLDSNSTVSNKKTEYGIGEVASSEGIDIQVTSWKSVNQVNDGYSTYYPDGDNKIYIVFIEFKNNTDSKCSVNPVTDIVFYVDDYENEMVGLGYDPPRIDGIQSLIKGGMNDPVEIAPGKKVKGYLSLQAPSNWDSFELVYQDEIIINLSDE